MRTNKVMICKRPECPRPLEMKPFEYEQHWVFVCETCGSRQVWDKARPEVGGTRGAGEKANKQRSVVGGGF